MIKFATVALNTRVNALLCCSAAVLLTACGGGMSDTEGQRTRTASHVYNSATEQAAPQSTTETEAGYASTDIIETDDSAAGDTRLLGEMVAVSTSDQIVALYVKLLGRQPDAAGLKYWTDVVNSGVSLTVVEASIKASDEYKNRQQITNPPSTYHLYVSPTGSDKNPGTKAAPLKTINRAAALAKPSTTVHVAPGTYRENVSTRVSGTASARIRFVSDTKWGAKVIGSGTEAMWNNNASYTDIVGFDISGPGRLGVLNMGSYTLVQGNHIHDIKVSGGCTGAGGAGIVNANYKGSDGDIIGNVVHDIGVPGKCNGVQGIYSSNPRGKIMNNVVYRASAWGIHLWHAANNVLIANNTVFANGAGNMGGGIEIGTGDAPGGIVMNNTKVINNIVYNNAAGSIKQYCYSGENCIGKNNVVANNLVYGNGRAISLKVGTATGTIAADPQFVSYSPTGSGNYRLKSTSPAINKGVATSAPTTDIDGVARPRGAAHDIGAYETL